MSGAGRVVNPALARRHERTTNASSASPIMTRDGANRNRKREAGAGRFKIYLISYRHEGTHWELELPARSATRFAAANERRKSPRYHLPKNAGISRQKTPFETPLKSRFPAI